MELKDIMAISGKPGLFRFVSQGRNAMIVESIEGGVRTSAFATDKISALDDIAIFTDEGEKALKDVLRLMFRMGEGKEALSHKSSADELKSYFEEVLPEYDRERVYVSDIKKVIQWYNILLKLDLIDLEEDEAEEDVKAETEAKSEKAVKSAKSEN